MVHIGRVGAVGRPSNGHVHSCPLQQQHVPTTTSVFPPFFNALSRCSLSTNLPVERQAHRLEARRLLRLRRIAVGAVSRKKEERNREDGFRYLLNPNLRSLSIDIQLCAYMLQAEDSLTHFQEFNEHFQSKLDHYVETFVSLRSLCSSGPFIRLVVGGVTIGVKATKASLSFRSTSHPPSCQTPDEVLRTFEMILSNFNTLEEAAARKDVEFESVTLRTAVRLDPSVRPPTRSDDPIVVFSC